MRRGAARAAGAWRPARHGDVTFAELLAAPGVTEVCELRSRFGFLAFHGGNLEKVTDVIAVEAAQRSDASVYAVLQPDDLHWHIPSHTVDPASSPALAGFLDHVEVAVAVHGYGREGRWTDVLLGGSNRALAAQLAESLAVQVGGYRFVADLEEIPPALRGLHPENPVNRPAHGGVQLELPPRVRGLGPMWAGWTRPRHPPPTEELIAGLAEAARSWSRPAPVRSGLVG